GRRRPLLQVGLQRGEGRRQGGPRGRLRPRLPAASRSAAGRPDQAPEEDPHADAGEGPGARPERVPGDARGAEPRGRVLPGEAPQLTQERTSMSTGAKPIETQDMLLNMGPQHPSTHGVLRLVIRTDGEMVSEVTPVVGYLHRCAEKIGE